MSEFITELDVRLKDNDRIWVINFPLIYISDILGKITVPLGFETDLSSVPRIPFIYMLWGGKAHREGVLHDYLYRIDSRPWASFDMANDVFLEAMKCRGKSWFVRYPMYWGVCVGGFPSYYKRKVGDKL